MSNWLRALGAIALTAVLAGTATAQVNLSWIDCGAAGTVDQTFACNVNTGAPHTMIGSYIGPAGTQNVIGMSAVVDLINTTPALENWWKFGTGNCRPGGFSASTDFASGPFTCVDFWASQATTVSNSQVNGSGRGVNTVRLQVGCALVTGDTLSAGIQYYGFKILISNQNTLTCTGCLTPTCIVFNSITIVQPAGLHNDFFLTGPAPGGRDFVTWQGSGALGSCATVPVRNRTWGQIKGMYR